MAGEAIAPIAKGEADAIALANIVGVAEVDIARLLPPDMQRCAAIERV